MHRSFDTLPDDVALEIFARIKEVRSLCMLACVNRQLRTWSEDDNIWKPIFASDFPWVSLHAAQRLKSDYAKLYGVCKRGMREGKLKYKTLIRLGERSKIFNLNPIGEDQFVVAVTNHMERYGSYRSLNVMDEAEALAETTFPKTEEIYDISTYNSGTSATPLTFAVSSMGNVFLTDHKGDIVFQSHPTDKVLFAACMDDRRVFAGGFNRQMNVFNYHTQQPIWHMSFSENVMSFAQGDGGNTMAVGTIGEASLCDLRSQKCVSVLDLNSGGYIWRVYMDERDVVCPTWDGSVFVYDRRYPALPKLTIDAVCSETRALMVANNTVMVAGKLGALTAFDQTTGTALWAIPEAHTGPLTSISMQGSTILTTGWDGVVKSWSPV